MRKKFLTGMLAVAMVNSLWANPAWSGTQTVKAAVKTSSIQEDTQKDFVAGHVLVSVKQGMQAADLFKGMNAKGAQKIADGESFDTETPDIYLITLKSQKKQDVLDAVEELKNIQGVVGAQPDYIIRTADSTTPSDIETPDDPKFSEQYGLKQANVPVAWNASTGKGVVVGVIDSGIDYNHPDLKDNIWTNPGEIPDDGIDNDGNGYVDDIHGWNCVDDNNDPMDDYYHGTHVAGIIGASANNGQGVVGVAPDVKMVAIKFIDKNGDGTSGNAIRALQYARANKIPIINASWGLGTEDLGAPALFHAVDGCGLFVAAAGNDSSDNDRFKQMPSGWSCDNIIAVAATNEDGDLHVNSNYGATTVDIAAPGKDIMSTYPVNDPKGMYGLASGTSMAAPYVTGTAALILSIHPEYTTAQLKQAILDSAEYSQKLAGRDATNGILNTARALGAVTKYQGVDYKDVFDYTKYSNSYQDVNHLCSDSPIHALQHFVEIGMKDGRPASDEFDPRAYRTRYQDLDKKYGDDWNAYYLQYMNEGKTEGRIATANFKAGDLNGDGQITENDLYAMSDALRFYNIGKSEGHRWYDARADLDYDLDIDQDDYTALQQMVTLK